MAKRYDPIMCMLVDEPTKAQDEILFYQLRFSSGRTEGAKLDESEIRSYAEALLEKYGEKQVAVSRQGKIVATYFNRKAYDSASALNKAIKTADAKVHDSVDIEHIADYLWTWASGRDIAHELFHEGLDKYSGPHDPEHKKEAYEFARKYATSELNKVYSKLKSVVEKRLKEGFETNKRFIDSYK